MTRRYPDTSPISTAFDQLEMTPEEKVTIRKAKEKVTEYKKETIIKYEKRLAYPIIRVLKKAIRYFSNNLRQLVRYLPDTNLIENRVPPITVGRKDYLFCSNHKITEDATLSTH